MNTAALKNAAIAKAKGAVSSSSASSNGAANGGASKKRRGNNQLKPIITNESGGVDKGSADSKGSTSSTMNKYVVLALCVNLVSYQGLEEGRRWRPGPVGAAEVMQ